MQAPAHKIAKYESRLWDERATDVRRVWWRDFRIYRWRGNSHANAVTMASQNSYYVGRGFQMWWLQIPNVLRWSERAVVRTALARRTVKSAIERAMRQISAYSTPPSTPLSAAVQRDPLLTPRKRRLK